jgi:hypothetical protein
MPKTKANQDRYELRLYDDALIVFSVWEDGLAGLAVSIHFCRQDLRHLLPIGIDGADGKAVARFLRSRVIPKDRAYVHEILAELGLSADDTLGILRVCLGLSLNDSYWIVPEGFGGKFADCNLYENHFSDALSLAALTGERPDPDSENAKLELTTGGNLPKAWRHTKEEGMVLYKGASLGREPYSEYYAWQIASRMGLPAVAYDLEEYQGVLVSKCSLFTDIDTAYVPAGRFVKGRGIAAALDYYDALGAEFGEGLRSLLAFDCVVCNIDRHFGNFGLLRDSRTGKFLRPAPIYDNGLSLYANVRNPNVRALAEYENTLTPYEISFATLAKAVIGERQREQIAELEGFTFERHPAYNLPEDLLCAVAERIRIRSGRYLQRL